MNAINNAVQWIMATIAGPAGTAAAVIGVAFIGLATLSGRLQVKRAGLTLVGCFILFGAPQIAAGLLLAIAAGSTGVGASSPVTAPAYAPAKPSPSVYDPYAGASVPTRESRPGDDLPDIMR